MEPESVVAGSAGVLPPSVVDTDGADEPRPATSDGLFIVGSVVKEVTSDEKTDGIRNHIASLLQVHNLVILMGAGASFHLGSPHIRNLKNQDILDLIADAGIEADESDGQLLQLLNPEERGDLEALLNNLQLAQSFGEKLSSGSVKLGHKDVPIAHIRDLRKHLNAALAFACQLPAPGTRTSSSYAIHKTFLSRLARARRENLPRPKIFTTNYDLVIEQALDELGYPYIDGFSGTVDRRLNMSVYGLDFHRVDSSSQAVVSRAENSFYLHKLHGSLNWRASELSQDSGSVESIEVTQVQSLASVSDGAVLIYPTSSKEGDTLSYPYTDLFRLLSTALQQPDTAVLTIGYGFWDAHINRILLGSLTMNPGMNLMIVDPGAVFGAKADLGRLDSSSRGVPVNGLGIALAAEQPVAEIAGIADSRIAVFTGPRATFKNFAELLPDQSIFSQQISPTALAQLIERLGQPAPITEGPADV